VFFIFLNGIVGQNLRGRRQDSVRILMEDFGEDDKP